MWDGIGLPSPFMMTTSGAFSPAAEVVTTAAITFATDPVRFEVALVDRAWKVAVS